MSPLSRELDETKDQFPLLSIVQLGIRGAQVLSESVPKQEPEAVGSSRILGLPSYSVFTDRSQRKDQPLMIC